MNIYISAIDKGDGKTFISAGLSAVMQSLGYNAGVYKPIQTGAIDKGKYLVSPDLAFIKLLDPYITTHCTYMLKSKSEPLIAAKTEQINIDKEKIIKDYDILTKNTDILVTEAPSNLMTPLNDDFFTYNIPLILNLPVIFIVTPKNNSISNYLNEINTARTAGLDILGVIINKFSAKNDNQDVNLFPELIEKYSDVKVMGIVRNFQGNRIKANMLINEILNGIDIEDVFNMKIQKLHL